MIEDIELKTYTYSDLCLKLGQEKKKGNSKTAQLKAWKNAFEFEVASNNLISITKIIDLNADISVRRGGARKGSGKEPRLQKEFEFLTNVLLHREFNRNVYNGQAIFCEAHFTSSVAMEYFGIYSDHFYTAKNDVNVDTNIFNEVSNKLREKFNSLVINKMKHTNGIVYSRGIVAYKFPSNERKDDEKKKNALDFRDEWLDEYDKHIGEYMEKNHTNYAKIISQNMWSDFVGYCTSFFDGYAEVIKTHKLSYDIQTHPLKDYDDKDVPNARKAFNDAIANDVLLFFANKYAGEDIGKYKYIIDEYVRI